MFRHVADFEKAWAADSEATLKVLRTLTDASLAQAVVPGGRTLGRLAWHLASRSLLAQVKRWDDARLEVEDDMHGQRWARGFTLTALLEHQIHHRGQMTVLMRQAGLRVPGIYGPAREDWASMGIPAEP
jgi:uncharacterized damage-inducible protein DinB